MNSVELVILFMALVGFAVYAGKFVSFVYLKIGQYKLNKVKKRLNGQMVKCDGCGEKVFKWEMTVRPTTISIIGEPTEQEVDRWEEAMKLQANPPTNTYCPDCSHTHYPFSNIFFGGVSKGKLTIVGGTYSGSIGNGSGGKLTIIGGKNNE